MENGCSLMYTTKNNQFHSPQLTIHDGFKMFINIEKGIYLWVIYFGECTTTTKKRISCQMAIRRCIWKFQGCWIFGVNHFITQNQRLNTEWPKVFPWKRAFDSGAIILDLVRSSHSNNHEKLKINVFTDAARVDDTHANQPIEITVYRGKITQRKDFFSFSGNLLPKQLLNHRTPFK